MKEPKKKSWKWKTQKIKLKNAVESTTNRLDHFKNRFSGLKDKGYNLENKVNSKKGIETVK